MNRLRGLTLIEVLAATALLSLVAVIGLGIVRQAHAAERRAAQAVHSTAVVEQWNAEVDPEVLRRFATSWATTQDAPPPIQPPPLPLWEHQDEYGNLWRATVVGITPLEAADLLQPDVDAKPAVWQPRWLAVRFDCMERAATSPRHVTTVYRTFPPENRP